MYRVEIVWLVVPSNVIDAMIVVSAIACGHVLNGHIYIHVPCSERRAKIAERNIQIYNILVIIKNLEIDGCFTWCEFIDTARHLQFIQRLRY